MLPLYTNTHRANTSRPIRAWKPWDKSNSAQITGRLAIKSGIWLVSAGGTNKLTSYWSAMTGFPPVVGVFMGALPVGVKLSVCRTERSIQVALAPVSIKACIGTGFGMVWPAVVSAARRAPLTPIKALNKDPCGEICKVKWGTFVKTFHRSVRCKKLQIGR